MLLGMDVVLYIVFPSKIRMCISPLMFGFGCLISIPESLEEEASCVAI